MPSRWRWGVIISSWSPRMSVQVHCPNCQEVLKVPDTETTVGLLVEIFAARSRPTVG